MAADRRRTSTGLGAILYKLLAGRPPFQGASALETLQQLRDTDRPAGRLRPGLPRDLETICLKCLRRSRVAGTPPPASWPTTCGDSSTAGRSCAAHDPAGRAAKWRGAAGGRGACSSPWPRRCSPWPGWGPGRTRRSARRLERRGGDAAVRPHRGGAGPRPGGRRGRGALGVAGAIGGPGSTAGSRWPIPARSAAACSGWRTALRPVPADAGDFRLAARANLAAWAAAAPLPDRRDPAGHAGRITMAGIVPAHDLVATAGDDNAVRVRRISDGAAVAPPLGARAPDLPAPDRPRRTIARDRRVGRAADRPGPTLGLPSGRPIGARWSWPSTDPPIARSPTGPTAASCSSANASASGSSLAGDLLDRPADRLGGADRARRVQPRRPADRGPDLGQPESPALGGRERDDPPAARRTLRPGPDHVLQPRWLADRLWLRGPATGPPPRRGASVGHSRRPGRRRGGGGR